jgi:sugar phosphate isomerase/epimerase
MAGNVEETLDRVAAFGYEEVEFAGYFGRTPQQIHDALGASGLAGSASHVPVETLGADWDAQLEAAETMGHRYLVVAWLTPEQRSTIDDYKRYAELFNQAGERAQAAGIGFAYHNHDFEFLTLDGEVPFDVLLAETDPKLVRFELDLFWITKGGRDPLAYFGAHRGRFPLVHVKDMDAGGEMVRVGAGTIDFASIFARREEAGIEHAFVEHDNPTDPFASIDASLDYLDRLTF